MKLAIMQPYFLPYIGYFQLMNFVDKYVFYDDVNYIKNGWINRNRIIVNGQSNYITLQQIGASPFKKINEIGLSNRHDKLIKTIEQSYKKHLFFNDVMPVIENVFVYKTNNLSDFVINSNIIIAEFLDINTEFLIASEDLINQHLNGQERVIDICQTLNAKQYINAIGGKDLYDFETFKKMQIELKFIRTNEFIYDQKSTKSFVKYLSIIDVLMNCGKEQTIKFLNAFSFE